MRFGQRGMRAREVRVVIGEFAVLVAAGNTGRQPSTSRARARSWQSQRVTRRSLVLAVGAVRGLPSCTVAEGTNFYWGLDHVSTESFIPDYRSRGRWKRSLTLAGRTLRLRSGQAASVATQPFSTLHPARHFAQAGIPARLCTSCERRAAPVESRGKRSVGCVKPLRQPNSGKRGCETGFRRGFSQLTFLAEGAQYETVRFPNSAHSHFSSRCRLGMNETCEERL